MKEKQEFPNRVKIPGTQWYKNKTKGTEFKDQSLTSQEFKDETNIDWIVRTYGEKSTRELAKSVQGIYGDATGSLNLHDRINQARELTARAEQHFLELPADVRKKFDNDVAKLAQWLEDPQNDQEARSLGLKTVQTDTKNVSVSTITSSGEGAAQKGAAKDGDPGKGKNEQNAKA